MVDIAIKKKLNGAEGAFELNFESHIQEGDLVTIYGSSGTGKTSILRMLSGLLAPDSGHIRVGDDVWFDSSQKLNIKPQQRNIGMVFQDYSLFPNMNIMENLEFALEKGQSKSVITDLLDLIELNQLAHKRPLHLSGGQKQRVALARALVRKPTLLLLDEPLSALGIDMQAKLQDYILMVHKEFKLTTILISHDLIEVIKMSQRVLILEDGRVVQDGKPVAVLPLDSLREFINRGLI